ncbi:MAG TPA: hypothetical protein VJU53_15920 [Burkholderiaceae bacterium]|nr:hypothetical protein [Burkholderiaceae bacterium]
MHRTIVWAAVGVLAGVVTASSVSAQVVADDACPKYAVDIAAFATCDGDRVAKAELAIPPTETRDSRAASAVKHSGSLLVQEPPDVTAAGDQPYEQKYRKQSLPTSYQVTDTETAGSQ